MVDGSEYTGMHRLPGYASTPLCLPITPFSVLARCTS